VRYHLYIIKRQLEDICIYPFVAFGRQISKAKISHCSYDIIFIFPFYHTGGAEKVHLEIARTFNEKKCLVLFTRKSIDNCFKDQFNKIGHTIIDISKFTDNKFTYWNNLIWRGVISSLINNQKGKTIVFNGQSNFGYKLSRWINPACPQVELIHSFNSFSWIRIPFISHYIKTVMISQKAIEQHIAQYETIQVPSDFKERIIYINNGVEVDLSFISNKLFKSELNVLYVGRATTEKRPALFGKIARHINSNELPIHFQMAGDIEPFMDDTLKKGILFHGAIHDAHKMQELYDKTDILMLTSSEEGFPLVIMEAMARGCVIISTPVGDIPHHVKNDVNGYLFSSSMDEQTILEESLIILKSFHTSRDLLKQISQNNVDYAKKVFDLGNFAETYKKLIESIKA
jgi:glycosyltransferase involved in cell wall biosynthesis